MANNSIVKRREYEEFRNDVKSDIKVLFVKITKIAENDLPHIQSQLIKIDSDIQAIRDSLLLINKGMVVIGFIILMLLLGMQGPAIARALGGLI